MTSRLLFALLLLSQPPALDPTGVADSGPQLRAMLARANAAGGVVELPPGRFKVIVTSKAICLGVESHVILKGSPGRTVLAFESDSELPTEYREGLRLAGDRITLDGLVLTRRNSFPGVLVKCFPTTRLTVRDCVLDGAPPQPGPPVQGAEIAAAPGGITEGLRVERCEFKGLAFGLFAVNGSTVVVRDAAFADCKFRGNGSDDLCFNATKAPWEGIRVVGCSFTGNLSAGPDDFGGSGVSLANCRGVTIRDCYFADARMEPIHAEAGTSDVTIAGCRFERCGMAGYSSGLSAINGARRFIFVNNHVDGTAAPKWPCAYFSPGGPFPTATEAIVKSNIFVLAPQGRAVACDPAAEAIVAGNLILRNPPGRPPTTEPLPTEKGPPR